MSTMRLTQLTGYEVLTASVNVQQNYIINKVIIKTLCSNRGVTETVFFPWAILGVATHSLLELDYAVFCAACLIILKLGHEWRQFKARSSHSQRSVFWIWNYVYLFKKLIKCSLWLSHSALICVRICVYIRTSTFFEELIKIYNVLYIAKTANY